MSLNQEISKIKNLTLAAKLVSDQIALGLHQSKKNGLGVEFEQYRHYEPGDDPKHIDWKLFARSQKHQVRVSTTESRLTLKLILDISGSMNYYENNVSRLWFAKVLLASLAYMGYKQNDALQLYFFSENGLEVAVNQQKQAFQNIVYNLENIKANGNLNFETASITSAISNQKELIILVSDLLHNDEEYIKTINSWALPGKEILIFHVLGQKEINPDFEGMVRFKDLENQSEIELAPKEIINQYRENVEAYLNNLNKQLLNARIHYSLVYLDVPIAEAIVQTLKKIRWSF
jgi:uncharacterized protein (DUF58 family)